MKFVCDRCGKKYATAEDPAPGKVYRLKCKACGHLIVVRGQAGAVTGHPATAAAVGETASPTQEVAPPPPVPPPHPGIELHVEPEPPPAAPDAPSRPEPLAPPAEPSPEAISDDAIEPLPPPGGAEPAPLPPEVARAVDDAAASHPEPMAPPTEPAPALDPALVPPPPEKDELADFAAAAAEVMAAPFAGADGGGAHQGGPGYVDLFGDVTGQRALPAVQEADTPFAAAARASLPDAWSGGTPTADPPTQAPPVPPRPPPLAAREAPRKTGLGGIPMAIIGAGVVALVVITGYALLGRGGAPAPQAVTPPRPAVAPPIAPAPRPTEPATEARVEPEVPPEAAESKPEPKAEARPRPPERKPERKPEAKVERKPEPPAPPPAPPPEVRPEAREPELPEAATALTQDVVDKVVGANRRAFTTCISNAKGSDVKLDGRRVALRITVNTNGTVTYPTLDDQSLNATEMGQCLKSAARLMIFPKFKGDPFHYEVPLILTGG